MLATAEATARYADRLPGVAKAHWREFRGLTVGSIGLGTYLGPDTDAADAGYVQAVKRALALGCNLFDTAINYRHQRSERALGRALAEAIDDGKANPQEFVVCTKGGYVPFDRAAPPDPAEALREYAGRGLIGPGDLVDDCHCITARYLQDQLERSLRNLQLRAVDVYYVHNPEHALAALPRDEFEGRLRESFAMLEKACDQKRVGHYGVATWNGLRADPRDPGHLSLERLLELAGEAAGDRQGHRFAVVQAPLNLAMTEALTAATQVVRGQPMPLLAAAQRLGVLAVTSASILQGRLSRGLPPWMEPILGQGSDAARALQFTRSAPGVTTALVGMGRPEHAEQNLALARAPPADEDALRMLFEAGHRPH